MQVLLANDSLRRAGRLTVIRVALAVFFALLGSFGWAVAGAESTSATRGVRNTTPSPALKGSPYHPDSVAARVRPAYRPNPAHNPNSPHFNPRKTPEPADAASVYQNATRADMGTWYGQGQGGWYRYFSDNAGGVHFSGTVPASQVPAAILRGQ